MQRIAVLVTEEKHVRPKGADLRPRDAKPAVQSCTIEEMLFTLPFPSWGARTQVPREGVLTLLPVMERMRPLPYFCRV